MDLTRGRGVDTVFDAAGALETINLGIGIARLGGRFILIGIPTESITLDVHTAMNKELDIQTVRRSNHNIHGAIDLMLAGRIPIRFITHRFPLEQAPCAFQILSTYADGVGKTLIEIP